MNQYAPCFRRWSFSFSLTLNSGPWCDICQGGCSVNSNDVFLSSCYLHAFRLLPSRIELYCCYFACLDVHPLGQKVAVRPDRFYQHEKIEQLVVHWFPCEL